MTEAEARAEIVALAQASVAPTLTEPEIRILVRKAKRADSSGRAPSDDAWEPTWNIAYAVALGWELKAGKLVGSYDFKSKDRSFSRSQMHKHCLEQARRWKAKGAESPLIPGGWTQRSILTQTNGYLEEDLPYLEDL